MLVRQGLAGSSLDCAQMATGVDRRPVGAGRAAGPPVGGDGGGKAAAGSRRPAWRMWRVGRAMLASGPPLSAGRRRATEAATLARGGRPEAANWEGLPCGVVHSEGKGTGK